MRHWRINLISFFIILVAAAIVSRLVYLQILRGDLYKALAQGQQKLFSQVQGERGEIFLEDKSNDLYKFATNKDYPFLYASPRRIEEKEKTAQVLSEIIDEDKDLILEKLKKDTFWQLIKNKLSEEEVASLQTLNLSGIYLSKNTLRYYPQETQASHVIGFVSGSGEGQYGVEGYYDEILRGGEELQEREKGPFGYFTFPAKNKENSGSGIVLTLDYNIQFMAEKLLKEAKEKWNIESGTIVVLNPDSGEILALANEPNFDLNLYSEVENLEVFQNSAIQKIFEPGSVFKPVIMAAALNEHKIAPQTKYIDQGFVKIGGFTIYNYAHKVWGPKTMTEVLEQSINTGAVFIEQQIGHKTFLDYIERFGFFEPSGIDLQGEDFSNNSELKKGYEVNFATASFGQGIAITPIQLTRFFAAIANGGELVRPHVVKKVIKDSGEEIEFQVDKTRVMEQETSSILSAMLVGVVENGIARRAQIPGYFVAGKTGTAQIPYPDRRGYFPEQTIQSFVGFAPAFNPEFLILVKLDRPQGTPEASVSTIPIFRELARYIIDYLGIPPDYE